mmetsp:Transcript_30971/g.43984  ORF Transcript_30971/g.43984 Transcript_30971/m.43984 type:complete len:344 (-) Transcript_30971:174-1205(-)
MVRFINDFAENNLHKRSVSYTEDDLSLQHGSHQPRHGKNFIRKSSKKLKHHKHSLGPTTTETMPIFDYHSMEPLSVGDDIGPYDTAPYQEWLSHSSDNSNYYYYYDNNTNHSCNSSTTASLINTPPLTTIHTNNQLDKSNNSNKSKSMFDENDDDLIRIPSLDSNMRWSPENPIIIVPNIGREFLVRAVHSGADEQIQSAQLSILEELKKITRQRAMSQKPRDLIAEADITEKDVICERGGKSNRHDGTKKYRGMVEKFKPKYQKMTAKNDKTNLSREIIKTIQSVGGRFLKKDEEGGSYYVLSPVETTKKVSQALREKKVLKWTQAAAAAAAAAEASKSSSS